MKNKVLEPQVSLGARATSMISEGIKGGGYTFGLFDITPPSLEERPFATRQQRVDGMLAYISDIHHRINGDNEQFTLSALKAHLDLLHRLDLIHSSSSVGQSIGGENPLPDTLPKPANLIQSVA